MRNVDNRWPRPRTTRHVWIRGTGRFDPPKQGYVLEWRRHSYKWSALVIFALEDREGTTSYVQRWFAAGQLWPVKSDPNGPDPFVNLI